MVCKQWISQIDLIQFIKNKNISASTECPLSMCNFSAIYTWNKTDFEDRFSIFATFAHGTTKDSYTFQGILNLDSLVTATQSSASNYSTASIHGECLGYISQLNSITADIGQNMYALRTV